MAGENLVKVVDAQNAVIKLQADIINELFFLLSQHISADELDSLPVISKVNTAAVIRQGVVEI